MLTRRVRCPKCRTPLAADTYNLGVPSECPGCRAAVQVEVFPAIIEPPRIGSAAERIMLDGESSCFFHPAKKAVVPCDGCGRFLCSICDIELSGQHLCPQCLESGKKKGKLTQLETRRTLYDSMALAFAIYPLLIIWLTIITAPLTLYIVIRHWKKPTSIIPRTKWRFVVAALIAGAQLTGWTVLFASIFSR